MPADLVTRLLLKNEEFDRNIKTSQKQVDIFQKRVSIAGSAISSFVGGFAGLAGVSFAVMDITQKSIQFEKSLSSLRSLTGVSAKELEFFKNEAIKLGSTSTQTASQVVEAFQLIGSQQPELLKDKDALAEVTKQAIILAEAAGMNVPEAAKALSGSINQMGESANVAGEYINILAAASQAGSADIQYLAKAIEKSGGAASSVGIKYNELVAAIESIAPKITEASEAGTNLRNIFLTLESSSDKNLKPSVVGLTSALENLSAKNLDATQMTKMFGKESVTAALAIVNAKDEYKNYITAITGTNTALEQQKINNDNLAGSINAVSSAWEGFILTVNNSNGIIKQSADFLAAFLGRLTDLMKTETQKQNELIQGGVEFRKKSLEKEIEGWMVLGDRKKAIEETMRQFSLRNPGGEKSIRQSIGVEIANLENMQNALKRFEPQSGIEMGMHKLSPYSFLSPGNVSEKNKLEERIKAQKQILKDLDVKNELYKQSVQYLENELKATEEINKVNKEGSGVQSGITDDMRKKWKVDAQIEDVTFKAQFDIESELQKKINIDRPVDIPLMPKLVLSDEERDITGSIADYQKKIQDVTIAYNEETNDALRSVYAKRITDMEEALSKMTDTNKGMINIASQVNSLIENSIVSGFEGIGEALASNDPSEAFSSMIGGLMDLLKQFGSALVAAGIASLAFKTLMVNPFTAIAAGGALIIAASAAKAALTNASRPMANGGVVYGETFARVGEYPGASSNPEVVAPLNKLRDLISPDERGGRFEVTGELIGRGNDLIAVINSTNRRNNRIK